MIKEITNEYGKRDIILSQYEASQILGISVAELRQLVKDGILTKCGLDMRGRYKVSMREVNKLKSEPEK